jgi:hypothetical protein
MILDGLDRELEKLPKISGTGLTSYLGPELKTILDIAQAEIDFILLSC